MFSIEACSIPDTALLRKYLAAGPPAGDTQTYADCYAAPIDASVTLADFVYAFYTTSVFRAERSILKHLAAKPSTDDQARQLADGSIDSFAAWNVEQRAEDQLLMCDFRGRTRSWFMVAPLAGVDHQKTVLHFGSAVVPRANRKTGKRTLGSGFSLLLGFHKLYSRVLLYSAKSRLAQR